MQVVDNSELSWYEFLHVILFAQRLNFSILSFAVGGSLNAGPQKLSRSWTINSKNPGAYLQHFPNVHFELHAQSMLVKVSLSTAFLCSLSFGFLAFTSALLVDVSLDCWCSCASSSALKSLRNEPNHSITWSWHYLSSESSYISHHRRKKKRCEVTFCITVLGTFFAIQNRNSRHSTQVSKSLISIHIRS